MGPQVVRVVLRDKLFIELVDYVMFFQVLLVYWIFSQRRMTP
jgi:hypothetical protein